MLREKDRIGEAPTVSRLRKRLETWLGRQRWTRGKLIDWLKGYELPAVGHDQEPYVWLLRAFSNSDRPHRQEMARRLAVLLDEESPHQQINGKYDDEFLYNLFYLCSGLQCRAELGEPLYRVYDFFERHKEKRPLIAESKRYNLSGALRDALITNQINRDLEGVWQQMLEGQPHVLLRGNRYSGAEGLLFMPRSEAERDQPALESIGRALAKMTESLEADKQRHKTFRRLVEQVKEVWPDHKSWDEDLLSQAVKHRWPMWAAVRLDALTMPLDMWTNGMQHFFVWEFYLPYLQSLESLHLIDFSPGQAIAEVRLGERQSILVNATRLCVEDARLNCPSVNYKNIRLASDEALKNLREQWLRHKEVWKEAEKEDSIFYPLHEGRIENLVAGQPQEKQQAVKEKLRALAAGAG